MTGLHFHTYLETKCRTIGAPLNLAPESVSSSAAKWRRASEPLSFLLFIHTHSYKKKGRGGTIQVARKYCLLLGQGSWKKTL